MLFCSASLFHGLLLCFGCLTPQQHASVSRGRCLTGITFQGEVGSVLRSTTARVKEFSPFQTAAENIGYTYWLLLLLLSVYRSTVSRLKKRNVLLSESAVIMGHSCLLFITTGKKNNCHCLTYLITCHRGGRLSHSHLLSQKRLKVSVVHVT